MSFFSINLKDNVATALKECLLGEHPILGETKEKTIKTNDDINAGHKVALRDIRCGEEVIKYGVSIGSTVKEIKKGEWVHLHNMKSNFDERSKTLDLETGVSTDIAYE